MVGRWNFFLGLIFRCYISFRECNLWSLSCCVISRWGHVPGGMHKSSSSLAAVVEVWAVQKTWNAPSFCYNSEARSSIGRELWGRVPKTLIHNSYGVLHLLQSKKWLNQPNSVTKVCSKRHSISFALWRSSGASWKHLPVKPQGVESRQMLSLTVTTWSHRIHFRNGNILTTT